jgi:hypothetical protein
MQCKLSKLTNAADPMLDVSLTHLHHLCMTLEQESSQMFNVAWRIQKANVHEQRIYIDTMSGVRI